MIPRLPRSTGLAALVSLFILCPAGLTARQEETPGGESDTGIIPGEIVVTAQAPDELAVGTPGHQILLVHEVRREGDLTVADILRHSLGIDIQRHGSGFEPSTMRIRGSEGGQVLILRDGVPLGDSRNSTTDLSSLSLNGVEKIEVFLGPATALFGIGGAAGAINLISADNASAPAGAGGTVRASWGSLGEYRLEGSGAATWERDSTRTTLDINTAGVYSRNSYTYERKESEETRTNAGGAEGNIRVLLERSAPAHRLRLEGSASAFRKGLPGTVEFPAAAAEIGEEKASLILRAGREDPWKVSGEAGISRSYRTYRDEEYPLGPLSSDSRLTSTWGRVTLNGTLGPVTLGLPLSVRSEFLDDTQSGGHDRTVISSALTVRSLLPQMGKTSMEVNFHGRMEVPFGSEGELLPSLHLGLGWTCRDKPVWWGVAASAGYRLPDFSELFLEGSAFAVGNPDLIPERSGSLEAEFRWGGPAAGASSAALPAPGLRAAAHLTGYRDLIQWLPDPNGYWRPRNTGTAAIGGLEIDVSLKKTLGLSPWDLDADAGGELLFALDRNEGTTYNKQLPYRPRLMFRAGAGLKHLMGHRISLTLEGRGARPITRQNSLWADPYLNINLGGTVALIPGVVTLEAAVRNLLDHKYLETRFYPNPGREIRILLEVKK